MSEEKQYTLLAVQVEMVLEGEPLVENRLLRERVEVQYNTVEKQDLLQQPSLGWLHSKHHTENKVIKNNKLHRKK